MANGYQIEGKENPAAKAAQHIGFDDIEVALLTGEAPAKPGEATNPKGSFERLMGFGQNGMKK